MQQYFINISMSKYFDIEITPGTDDQAIGVNFQSYTDTNLGATGYYGKVGVTTPLSGASDTVEPRFLLDSLGQPKTGSTVTLNVTQETFNSAGGTVEGTFGSLSGNVDTPLGCGAIGIEIDDSFFNPTSETEFGMILQHRTSYKITVPQNQSGYSIEPAGFTLLGSTERRLRVGDYF